MIIITTPTGQVGSQLVTRLLADNAPIRVIVRDAAKLDASVRERVEVIEGSHDDPAVLDRALPGADALFWLVPPNPRAPSAGHGWPKSAGLLSAAFAMDAELERLGTVYRALSMPFYMDNLDRHLDVIRKQGTFSLTYTPDRPRGYEPAAARRTGRR